MVEGAGKTIYETVKAWEYVTTPPYNYKKTTLRFAQTEFAYLYGDSKIEFLPSELDLRLRKSFAKRSPLTFIRGWFTYNIDSVESIDYALQILHRSYESVASKFFIKLPEPPSYLAGVDLRKRFPQYIPEDRAVFLQMLENDVPKEQIARFKLINQNPKLQLICIEPWGSCTEFPFGTTLEVIMKLARIVNTSIPDIINCTPQRTNFLDVVSKEILLAEFPDGGLTIYVNDVYSICFFYEDGVATNCYGS